MDEKFLECCFNARHEILGYKLKPYSLSHLLVLEGRKNPLVTGEGRVTASHLVDAILVCSRTQFPFRRNKSTLWSRVAQGAVNANVWFFAETLRAFREYQEDFVSVPEFWDSPDEGISEISGPYVLATACSVMMTYPQMAEDRVWTMALGLLSWYGAQASEFKLGRRFWDEAGEDEIEEGLRAAEDAITPEMRAFAEERAKAFTLSKRGESNGAGGISG